MIFFSTVRKKSISHVFCILLRSACSLLSLNEHLEKIESGEGLFEETLLVGSTLRGQLLKCDFAFGSSVLLVLCLLVVIPNLLKYIILI